MKKRLRKKLKQKPVQNKVSESTQATRHELKLQIQNLLRQNKG